MRVTLETSLRPGGWPRAETPAHWWRWKVAFAMRWQLDKEHINILELRAALATLRWRTRQRRFQGMRVIHLIDSAVVIGVLTKRRSSNALLRHLVARANAIELASGTHVMYAFTRSTHNPADKPSRSFGKRQHRPPEGGTKMWRHGKRH